MMNIRDRLIPLIIQIYDVKFNGDEAELVTLRYGNPHRNTIVLYDLSLHGNLPARLAPHPRKPDPPAAADRKRPWLFSTKFIYY